VRSKSQDESEVGIIINEYKHTLATNKTFSLGFLRRQDNGVTHALAKATPFYICIHFFFYQVPPCVVHLIINEMT